MKKSIYRTLSLLLLATTTLLSACNKKENNPSDSTSENVPSSVVEPSSTNSNNSSSSASSIYIPTGDVWTVTFDYNYETGFKTYLESKVKDGETVQKPANPIRSGYDFVDWYSDPYCRNDHKWDFDNDIIIKNTTIYACWERNDDPIDVNTYTINYQSTFGAEYVSIDGGSLTYSAEYGEVIQFKIVVDEENYEGNPVVKANGVEVEPNDGIYTYSITGNTTLTISGLVKKTSGSYYVYYDNANNWDTVYIYMWRYGTEDVNNSWPGVEMNYDSKTGYYTYEIESIDDFNYNMVIFNNGASEALQTEDLELVTSYATKSTLYYYENNKVVCDGFDPNDTKSTIIWTESDDYQFISIDDKDLPLSVDNDVTVSFKVNILLEEYENDYKVYANAEELVAQEGIYSFVATTRRIVIKITGLVKLETVDFYYTIPEWNPPVTNPKLYYWGTDGDGNEYRNTLDWDNASDTLGSMTLVENNTYKMSVELDDNCTITGVIVVMYQDGVKKQSIDIVSFEGGALSINEAGEYDITFIGGQWPNGNFEASITKRG